MEWLNLHSSQLDSEELIGSEPVDRATWLFLRRYCVGQENGGIIRGAGAWNDRKWQQLVRVTVEEARRSCALWKWVGDDLIVWGHDCAREAEFIAKREGGRRGGKARSEVKTQAALDNGKLGGRPRNPSSTQADNPSSTQAETQPKGKERKSKGKGMEGGGTGAGARDSVASSSSSDLEKSVDAILQAAGINRTVTSLSADELADFASRPYLRSEADVATICANLPAHVQARKSSRGYSTRFLLQDLADILDAAGPNGGKPKPKTGIIDSYPRSYRQSLDDMMK